MWGRGLVKNVIWREELAKNAKYRHIEGRGLKLLKKPSYDISRSLSEPKTVVAI